MCYVMQDIWEYFIFSMWRTPYLMWIFQHYKNVRRVQYFLTDLRLDFISISSHSMPLDGHLAITKSALKDHWVYKWSVWHKLLASICWSAEKLLNGSSRLQHVEWKGNKIMGMLWNSAEFLLAFGLAANAHNCPYVITALAVVSLHKHVCLTIQTPRLDRQCLVKQVCCTPGKNAMTCWRFCWRLRFLTDACTH